MYATGRLGAADRVRAYVWLAVANQVFQDPTVAKSRDDVAATLTPAQIERAKAQVSTCMASKFRECGEPGH